MIRAESPVVTDRQIAGFVYAAAFFLLYDVLADAPFAVDSWGLNQPEIQR
jgi:hypothetical protein